MRYRAALRGRYVPSSCQVSLFLYLGRLKNRVEWGVRAVTVTSALVVVTSLVVMADLTPPTLSRFTSFSPIGSVQMLQEKQHPEMRQVTISTVRFNTEQYAHLEIVYSEQILRNVGCGGTMGMNVQQFETVKIHALLTPS